MTINTRVTRNKDGQEDENEEQIKEEKMEKGGMQEGRILSIISFLHLKYRRSFTSAMTAASKYLKLAQNTPIEKM